MALNINLKDVICNAHNSITDSLDDIINTLNVLKLNQHVILDKMDDINKSINNITSITPPTEPDPGPTEPDEPNNPIPVVPKLKFSDTTNISNFSVKINENIYTSDNWTPDLTIDITPGQKLNFEIWADNYYLFDNNPGIAITSNGITKAVALLPLNGKYTGSKTLETTLNNDIILDISAAASLQPFNEDAPEQPYNPLHPDTVNYVLKNYNPYWDEMDMNLPNDALVFENGGSYIYANIPIPPHSKVLKLHTTVNTVLEIYGDNKMIGQLSRDQYLYNNDISKLEIRISKDSLQLSPDGTYYYPTMGDIKLVYTPRTDITIISSSKNINNPDNYIAAYTDNPSNRYCVLRFISTIPDESGKYPYTLHSSCISSFYDNDIQPCTILRDYDNPVNIIAIKKEVNI